MISTDFLSDTLNLELEQCKVSECFGDILRIDCPDHTIARQVLELCWEWTCFEKFRQIQVYVRGQPKSSFTPAIARDRLLERKEWALKMYTLTEESGLLVPQSIVEWDAHEIFSYVLNSGEPWALSTQEGSRLAIAPDWHKALERGGDNVNAIIYAAESKEVNVSRWDENHLLKLIAEMGKNDILKDFAYRARLAATNEWAWFNVHAQELIICGRECRLLSLQSVEKILNET